MDMGFIFTSISLITIFLNGFYWRKRSWIGILISVTIAEISFILRIILEGWPKFGEMAMRTSTNDIATAVLVVIGIWILGYIAGGINFKNKEKVDDYPNKIIEKVTTDFDK